VFINLNGAAPLKQEADSALLFAFFLVISAP
jgi:hypothetical protein